MPLTFFEASIADEKYWHFALGPGFDDGVGVLQ
jgi:hypothetical protein